jgi:CotH protein.
MKKLISVVILVAIALSVAIIPVSAAPGVDWFGIDGSALAGQASPQAGQPKNDIISWYKSGDQYYVFFPKSTDLNAVVPYFTASAAVNLSFTQSGAGTPITSGTATNLFANVFASDVRADAWLKCDGVTYKLRLAQQSEVASIFISTEKPLSYIEATQNNKDKGTITITNGAGEMQYDGVLDQIKGRGNATWGADKKPYNIKLNKKTGLFGLAKSKKWSLLANRYDASQIRNKMATEIAREIGIDFAPEHIWADLYINNEYRGLYTISQKVEIEEGRVDIFNLNDYMEEALADSAYTEEALEDFGQGGVNDFAPNSMKYWDIPANIQPEDNTGGFLLEMELDGRYAAEASGFCTTIGQAVVIKYPEFASQEQVSYIKAMYQDMENAIYDPSGVNSNGKHFSEYIDVESFAKAYALHEWSLSLDVAITSFYLYKDSDTNGDGKIHCGVPWDWDNAFGGASGSRDGVDLEDPTSWWANQGWIYGQYGQPNAHKHLIAAIWQHESFQRLAKATYFDELMPAKDKLWETNGVSWSNLIGTSARSDNARWGGTGQNSAWNKMALFMDTRTEFMSDAWVAELYGDADEDGTITTNDAFLALNFVTGKMHGYDRWSQHLANIDRANGLQAIDALSILKKALILK